MPPLPLEEVAEVRHLYECSSEALCLLNVGVTQQRENISTVLKVLASVRNRGVPVRLCKVGEGLTAEQKDFIRANNLEQLITLIGKLSKAILLKLYNAADALLAPSLYEGFGLTIVEATARRTSIITSNVSSIPGVVGNAAVSVDPFDVEAMTEAIIKIKRDIDYRNHFSQAGLLRSKPFSWSKAAEQIAIIYENKMLTKK